MLFRSFLQLAKVYTDTKNYQELIGVYNELIKLEPSSPQYHFSLAIAYKEISDFKNAKTEALKALELSPQSKEIIEEFLKNLP